MFPFLNFAFLSGWNNTINGLFGMVGGLQSIAYALLAITFLMGVYEAFIGGPSFRQLGVVVLKYAIASGIIASWSTFITDVVTAGAHVGTVVLGGGQDTFANLATQFGQVIAQQVSTVGGIFDVLRNASNGIVGVVELAMFVISIVWFQLALQILTMCFCLWGAVLFCIGPLLIALAPSGITSSYTRTYAKNLAEWAMWPAIYAIFADLMVNLNMGTVTQILGVGTVTPVGGDTLTAAAGALNFVELTIAALVCGLCMVAVPFIAHIVLGGSFGQAFGAVAGLALMAKGQLGKLGGGKGAEAGSSSGGGKGAGDSGEGGGAIGGAGSRLYSKAAPRHTEANDNI